MSKQDGGPAFPGTDTDEHGQPYNTHLGMSLRDYFAAKAMAATISRIPLGATKGANGAFAGMQKFTEEQAKQMREATVFLAYQYADAMLEARKVNP